MKPEDLLWMTEEMKL